MRLLLGFNLLEEEVLTMVFTALRILLLSAQLPLQTSLVHMSLRP